VFQITIRLLHVEVLPKAQIAENVKDQIIDLVGHIQPLRPLPIYPMPTTLLPEKLNPPTTSKTPSYQQNPSKTTTLGRENEDGHLLRVPHKKRLHAPQRPIRERIIQHPSLPSVRLNVSHIPGIGDLAVVRPSAVVRLSLHNISFGAEDGFVGGGGVHEHCVWAVAEDRSC
jgi:hypothetical protein